jgi:predicted SAM-dependent methyltransferase
MDDPVPGTGDAVKINLGCGDRYVAGWVNVDHAGSPHRKDETVDLTGILPWKPGSITHVYAGHVLEHLTIQQALDLLERLHPLMASGGDIMVVGPDVGKAEAMVAAGTFDFSGGHTLDSIKHGGHRWPGDEHRWECDAAILIDMLKETGWTDVAEIPIGDVPAFWPVADRRPAWQCAIHASR